jgi:acetyltransferase-like isoleucine patch superfamily enzyme
LVRGLGTVGRLLGHGWRFLTKVVYREPAFRARCSHVGKRLHLEGAVPQIFGAGRIVIGDDVVIGAPITWDLATPFSEPAELVIGDRVQVNFRNGISAYKRVEIGDDTLIAGNVQIYDNISHPVDPERRLRHDRLREDEAAPVIIGRNVWIGAGAIIMKGVTIGDNSVVAAGAIVTKSVPANTLVAGNPAAVIRTIG